MLHVYPTPIRAMISGRDTEKLLKNEKAVLDLRRDQVPPSQLLAQYRSIPDFSSAHCTPGSTEDGQNCTYDDQDDADGGQNTQPREEADQRQNNAENNHVRTSSGMRIKMIYSSDATTKTSHSINPIIDVVNTELVLLPNSLDVKTSAFLRILVHGSASSIFASTAGVMWLNTQRQRPSRRTNTSVVHSSASYCLPS